MVASVVPLKQSIDFIPHCYKVLRPSVSSTDYVAVKTAALNIEKRLADEEK